MDYKKQHYIPQVYLSAWKTKENKDGSFTLNYYNYRKKYYEPKNSNKVFFTNYLYSYTRENIYNLDEENIEKFHKIVENCTFKTKSGETLPTNEAIFRGLEDLLVFKNDILLTKKEKNEIIHNLNTTKIPEIEKDLGKLEDKWKLCLNDLEDFHRKFFQSFDMEERRKLFNTLIMKDFEQIKEFVYSLITRNKEAMNKTIEKAKELFNFSLGQEIVARKDANDGIFKLVNKKGDCKDFWKNKSAFLYLSRNGNFPIFKNLIINVLEEEQSEIGTYIPLTPNIILRIDNSIKTSITLTEIVGDTSLMNTKIIKANGTDFVIKNPIKI